ncbi:MAG TPA: hypothetical protein VJS65_13675 [Verrucomicrobiae bacterium]|nr:hypothetical protein [Verrucomicrobiae bacterium]
MTTKNLIRTVVVLGMVAWPSVETYRLWKTTQQLEQAQALERSVTAKLASARARHAHAQVAKTDDSSTAASTASK